MSYDLYIHDPKTPEALIFDTCPRKYRNPDNGVYTVLDGGDDDGKGAMYNYTYNLCGFFNAFSVNPMFDLNGLTGREAANRITRALIQIMLKDADELREEYDPPNHWGGVDTATEWLRSIRDYCVKHPDFILEERS